MKREIVYLKVKVVIEYDTKNDKKDALAHVKQGLLDISEESLGTYNWSYRPIQATLIRNTVNDPSKI